MLFLWSLNLAPIILKKAILLISGSIFLEKVGGMTLKLGEKIEKHLMDQESLLIGRYFLYFGVSSSLEWRRS